MMIKWTKEEKRRVVLDEGTEIVIGTISIKDKNE